MYILLEEGEVELAFEGWTWLSGRKAIAFLKGNNVRKSIEEFGSHLGNNKSIGLSGKLILLWG